MTSDFRIDLTLPARVRRTLRQHALARPETRVLVALSGGADSVALLHVALALHASGELVLTGAAHLHHGLRGLEADADEAFCRELTARLGVPFVSERADVRAVARAQKRSLEHAARIVRYAFLERAADDLGAGAIATAHTRDDQAETFLLRLLRGAATRGLASIRPRAGRVIRPLLDVPRVDLRRYLEALGAAFREDAHELLPVIVSRFSPAAAVLLARHAALAREDDDFLRSLATELARRIVSREVGIGRDGAPGRDAAIELDAGALAAAPRALSSRVAHHVMTPLAGGRPVAACHVERLLTLAASGSDGEMASLPGQHAERCGGAIVLRPGRGRVADVPNSFAFPLSIPGEVSWQPGGWVVGAEPLSSSNTRERTWTAKGPEVGVAAGAVGLPLAVRPRRPGDRFHPLGAPGARKLQDFLVDRKVPRAERDRLPLVVDRDDRIVWVAGHSVGHDFRVIDPAAGVLLLTLRRLGGVG